MTCYSEKYKHTCSKIVIGISFVVGLMSILAIIFGAIQIGKIPMTEDQKSTFYIQGIDGEASGIGKGNIAMGIFGLLLAFFGCATGKKKNFCFAIPYGIMSFIVTVIFLIIAISAFFFSSQDGQTAFFNTACGLNAAGGQASKTVKSTLNLQAKYTKYVDQPICSEYCQCPFVARFFESALSQQDLNVWGRYVDSGSNANGYSAPTKTDGLVKLQFVTQTDTSTATYTSYKECYTQVLSKQKATTSSSSSSKKEKAADELKTKMAAFASGGGFDLISDFEKKYDCAGFCVTPLFYATQFVNKRPTKECIKPIVKELGQYAQLIGAVALISFIVNFCGFCGSFALCSKNTEDEEEKDQNEAEKKSYNIYN